MRTAVQNRLAGTNAYLAKDIEAHMAWLNERLAILDDDPRRGSGPARCGGKTTIGCRVPQVLGPCVPGRCSWNSLSWGRSPGSRSRRWWVSRPCIVTVGPSVGGG
jgi:hypothetical protein